MNKSEAIARASKRDGAAGLDSGTTHFANVNSSKRVWWLDIPLEEIKPVGDENINLLLYDGRSDQLHHLRVPTAFLRDNRQRLAARSDKKCISLELSADAGNRFTDVRPTGQGVRFDQFSL